MSSNEATWPHRLQETLQRSFPNRTVEVINAGVPGFTASESLEHFRKHVLPLKPDLVIYYEANNQISHDTRALAHELGLLDESLADEWFLSLSQYSLLVNLLHKNARILFARDDDSGKLTEIPPELPSGFLRQLESLYQETQQEEITLVMSTFLVKYRRNQERREQIANADVAFYYMPWMTIDGLLDAIDLYNSAIVRFGETHGVPVIDSSRSIPADSTHYVDNMHMTDVGAAAMAERIGQFLLEEGIIKDVAERVTVVENR